MKDFLKFLAKVLYFVIGYGIIFYITISYWNEKNSI